MNRNTPLSRLAASPLSRLRREGGRRQRGGAALARRLSLGRAPVLKIAGGQGAVDHDND